MRPGWEAWYRVLNEREHGGLRELGDSLGVTEQFAHRMVKAGGGGSGARGASQERHARLVARPGPPHPLPLPHYSSSTFPAAALNLSAVLPLCTTCDCLSTAQVIPPSKGDLHSEVHCSS